MANIQYLVHTPVNTAIYDILRALRGGLPLCLAAALFACGCSCGTLAICRRAK